MNEKYARGRSSEIFKLDDDKVLKLFFDGYPKSDADREFKNTKIASELGATTLKVYEKMEKDGRYGFTMSFVDGICQNDLPGGPGYLLKGGKDLAKCHAIVHKLQSHEMTDIRKICVDSLDEEPLNVLTKEEKEKAKNYIMSLPEDDTIIHLDFHTGNVLVSPDGTLTVIDWMTAARGNRAVEYAMMEFLFSEAELFPEKSKLVNFFFGLVRGFIGKQFFKEYQSLMPLEESEVDKYRLLALIVRRSWNIDFEKDNLTKKLKDLINRYC